jgi:hypothetical protein
MSTNLNQKAHKNSKTTATYLNQPLHKMHAAHATNAEIPQQKAPLADFERVRKQKSKKAMPKQTGNRPISIRTLTSSWLE